MSTERSTSNYSFAHKLLTCRELFGQVSSREGAEILVVSEFGNDNNHDKVRLEKRPDPQLWETLKYAFQTL